MNKTELIKKYLVFILLIVVFFVIGLGIVLPILPKLITKSAEVKSKEASIKELKTQLNVIEQNKLQEQENNIKVLKMIYEPELKSSDSMVNFNGLLETVLNQAKVNGLKTRTIEFKTIPDSDIVKQNHSGTHNSTLLTAQMVGTYTELQNFLREIYRHKYIIGINEIKITPYEKDKKILVIDLSLGLYSKK